MGKMEDIREIIRHTNMRNSDAIEETKQHIKEIVRAKADYLRDIARMCEQMAEVLLTAIERSDFASAGRYCDIIVREGNNMVSKGMDLRRDIEEVGYFVEAY